MTDPDSSIVVIVEHKGKTYRQGPIRIIQSTQTPSSENIKTEVLFQALRLAKRLTRDIEYDEGKKK